MSSTPASSSSDAADSFLGYLYQLRFALLGGLSRRDANESVAVELLDDVRFANASGTETHLHQLKHSIDKIASLGARSENLWKTIGNWAQSVSDQKVDLNSTTLYLHTTGKISSQSPLQHLQLHNRNEQKALAALSDAAKSSTNEVIAKNLKKLTSLKKRTQCELMEQIYVIDSAADIAEAANEIEHVLAISSRPEDLQKHREFLEGWFFDRCIRSLIATDKRIVLVQEIRNQSITIRDFLVSHHLPILQLPTVPEDELSDDDKRVFVEQLRLINARIPRIRRAQTEHFQALTHRSEWSREGKLAIEELPRFDNRLVTEWQIRHDSACANCQNGSSQLELKEAERVYKWVEEHAASSSALFIRSSFSEPFLIRGSFHILSNRLAVGWHPRYIELLGDTCA